jgi:hypothetical protein
MTDAKRPISEQRKDAQARAVAKTLVNSD